MYAIKLQRMTAAAPVRPPVHPGEFPAATGPAQEREALVADDATGEAHQDRGEGCLDGQVRGLPNGGGRRISETVPAEAGTNQATATAHGGVGMMTESVKNLQNVREDRSGPLAYSRETVRSVTIVAIAVQVVVIQMAANQEQRLTDLRTTASCAKWPAMFIGQGSYGKSRFKLPGHARRETK